MCYNYYGDIVKKNIVSIAFWAAFLVFSMFVFFTKVLYEDSDATTEKREKLNDRVKEYTREEFDELVSDRLGLAVLVNKTSLGEMNNAERLRMLINQYKGNDRYDTFSRDEIEKIHKESVIKNLNIVYENLNDYYGTFLWNNSKVAYQYDDSSKTFKYTGVLGHGGASRGNISHKELVSMDTNGHTYTLKYRYIFYNSTGDGPSDVTLYLNIKDALNDNNAWKYLPVGADNSAHENEYINMHYNEIRDKLPIYTYIFKVENGSLVLTDFFVINP